VSPDDLVRKVKAMVQDEMFHPSYSKAKQVSRYLEKANRLLFHEKTSRSKLVTLPGGKRSYMIETINQNGKPIYNATFKGVTDTLRTLFYPDTSQNPIEKAKRSKALGGRIDDTCVAGYRKRACDTFGAKHGTIVHHQIEKLTERINSQDTTGSWWKQGEKLDSCVEAFMNLCIEKRWYPLRAEFIVFSEKIRTATATDIVFVDLITWELCFGEFKVGFEDEAYEAHPNDLYFRPPLEEIVNCPLNIHQLQTLLTQMIAEMEYEAPDKSYIINLRPRADTIAIYSHNSWCLDERNRQAIIQSVISLREYERSMWKRKASSVP